VTKLFEAARRVSVPIVVCRTSDQWATAETLKAASGKHPVVQWDAARGMTGLNVEGTAALQRAKITADNSLGFVEAMVQAQQLPQGAVVLAHNAHRQVASAEPIAVAAAVQAVANLRETYKANFRMLVLLGPYGFTVPTELGQDVFVLTDPLPGEEALGLIVRELYDAARKTKPSLKAPTAELVAKAVDALSGMNNFAS